MALVSRAADRVAVAAEGMDDCRSGRVVAASVIICTRNRRDRLETTLRSFEELDVPAGIEWELIVVDNNSTDGTEALLASYERRGTLPLLHLFERRSGKSVALNAALQRVRGEVVAFTDDDCVVDRSWLEGILREFKVNPSVGGVGGRVELYDLADHTVGTRTHRLREPYLPKERLALIFGCNMAFTRRVIRQVGEFDPSLGPGSRCLSGEDLDFLYRVNRTGFEIVYVPDIVVYHNHGRRIDRDVRASFRGYGVSKGALYCKHMLKGDMGMARVAYRELRWTMRRSARNLIDRRRASPSDIRPYDLFTGMLLYISTGLTRRRVSTGAPNR